MRFEGGHWRPVSGAVPGEGRARLHVNGREVASLMCTPRQLDALAVGFLYGEGIIEDIQDVQLVDVAPNNSCIDVLLRRGDFTPPSQVTITSGCGRGITFADLAGRVQPIESDLRVKPGQLCRLMHSLLHASPLHQQIGGAHSAGLAEDDRLLLVAEDIGRHNAIDKVAGGCLLSGLATRGRILLTSGRVSSEMLHRAARMEIPVVATRTSPTGLAVALADAWNITLVGYVKHDTLNVYAASERIVGTEDADEVDACLVAAPYDRTQPAA